MVQNCRVDFEMAIDVQATFVKLICPTIQKLPVTDSNEQNPCCEAGSCSATKIQCILWDTKFRYHVHNTVTTGRYTVTTGRHTASDKSSLHLPILFF